MDLGNVVRFEDDAPVAVTGTSTDNVDEDALPNGIDDGPGDIGLGVDAVATGSVTGLFQSGADVPLSYGFNTAVHDASGLTSGGVAVTYIITANLITAEAGAGNTVFTMALDATTGAWTFTLVRPLDHPIAGTGERSDHPVRWPGAGDRQRRRHGDGDGAVSVLVDDDTPVAVTGTSTDSVDEDALSRTGSTTGRATSVLVSMRLRRARFGTVPVRRGRSAELRLQHGRHAACGADFGRRCGDLHYHCEPDHGGGRGGQHGVHDGAERDDGDMDVHAGRSLSTIQRRRARRTI